MVLPGSARRRRGDAAMDAATCAKCGEQPAGEGGVLCSDCKQMLAVRLRDYWDVGAQDEAQPRQPGGEIAPSVS